MYLRSSLERSVPARVCLSNCEMGPPARMVARGAGGTQAGPLRLPAPSSDSPAVPRPSARSALYFVAGIAVVFFWVGTLFLVLMGEKGMVLAEWLLLFLPALVFVRWSGGDLRTSLSLRRPSVAGVAGGLLLVVGATPVGWLLAWLQTLVFPVPWEMLEGMERMLAADSPGPLLWLLVAVAVTPAVCEEIVFRGVLLGATRHLAPWRFLLLNGLVFGAFHLSLETWIRFLPTAWVGIVIAWAVWRTGSLFIGMLMHLVNNGVIVLAAAQPLPDEVTDPAAPPPLWLVPVALLALAAGLRITAELPGGPEPASMDQPTSEAT